MFKIILNLIWNRAPKKQWRMQIGAHLLKKGCGYEIGQIVRQREIGSGRYRVKVITKLFYDFDQNQINHRKENRIITKKEIEAAR